MKPEPIGIFLKQWTIHAFIVWAMFTAWDAIDFLIRMDQGGKVMKLDSLGEAIFQAYGRQVTIWDRIVKHNFHQLRWVAIFIGTRMAEFNYHFIVNNKTFKQFVAVALVCGGLTALTFYGGMHQSTRKQVIEQSVPVPDPGW